MASLCDVIKSPAFISNFVFNCLILKGIAVAVQVLSFLIKFSEVSFSQSMSKKASKRGWNDDYIQYGFARFSDKDAQKEKCVICYKVLGNDSLRPSK